MTPMGISGVLWFGPALLGVILILLGVLIVIVPDLLEYAVAGLLMIAGVSLIGVGVRMRRGVSYHQVRDNHWRVMDPFEDE